jgi:hypothetical protein
VNINKSTKLYKDGKECDTSYITQCNRMLQSNMTKSMLKTNSMHKNIKQLYRSINKFKDSELRINSVKYKNSDLLADLYILNRSV